MRLIDAEALREKAHKLPNGYNFGWFHECVDEMIDTAPTISDEELGAEAKRRGYALIKSNPVPKKRPCVCGRKLLEEWYEAPRKGLFYKCPACDRRADAGKTKREAIELWNEAVEKWEKMKAEGSEE